METVINTSLVTEVVNLAKSLLGLLSSFPLNVIVIGSLASVAFRILRKAKRIAR
jgi:hypothetical protein